MQSPSAVTSRSIVQKLSLIHISIRLNGEEHELLLEYTKNHNMTMTQVVKMAVLEKLMTDQK